MLGFDLVGNENQLRPLIDFIEPLLYFRKRQAEEGLEIPFVFHAGETLGDGDFPDNNVYDALLLGAKRIGHGLALEVILYDVHTNMYLRFSLVKHPKLMQACREQGIMLEVCPISYVLLV